MATGLSSKIENVYQVLAGRISTGQFPLGTRLPTEFELASEFGCGRHTVSQAITRLVHQGLVERRRRAGTRVIRNTLNSARPSVELDAFAFIHPSDRHEGSWRTVSGFQDAAQKSGRRVVTLSIGPDYIKEMELVASLAEFDVKAAALYPILPSPQIQVRLSALLVESRFPIVLVDLNLPGLDCPCVTVDNFHAGYATTRYLLDAGLSRIGFLTNYSRSSSAAERYRGYLWALEEAGKPFKSGRVLLDPSMRPNFADPLRDPVELSRRYLAHKPDVEGVVCGQDFVARGLTRAAAERGLRVPDDLRVAGIDDFAKQSPDEVPLTSYHVPFEEFGRKVFEVLDAVYCKKPMLELETRIRGEIVARASA